MRMNGLLSYPDELYHFGIPRKSGRYPWGSGERPYHGLSARIGHISQKNEQ